MGDPGPIYGVVRSGDYLILACDEYAEIDIYDANKYGKQSRLDVISGYFHGLANIKLGP